MNILERRHRKKWLVEPRASLNDARLNTFDCSIFISDNLIYNYQWGSVQWTLNLELSESAMYSISNTESTPCNSASEVIRS